MVSTVKICPFLIERPKKCAVPRHSMLDPCKIGKIVQFKRRHPQQMFIQRPGITLSYNLSDADWLVQHKPSSTNPYIRDNSRFIQVSVSLVTTRTLSTLLRNRVKTGYAIVNCSRDHVAAAQTRELLTNNRHAHDGPATRNDVQKITATTHSLLWMGCERVFRGAGVEYSESHEYSKVIELFESRELTMDT